MPALGDYPARRQGVKLRTNNFTFLPILLENAYAQLRCPLRNHAHIACNAVA